MRRSLGAAAFTSVVAALSLGLSATAAQAATITWTVTPGGAIAGSAGTTTLTDSTSGLKVICTSSSLAGSLKSGSGLKGKGIGRVTSIAFNNCTVDSLTLSVSTGTVAFPLNAKSYVSTSRVVRGSISGIHFAVSSSVCGFTVDGTSGTADNGTVKVSYANSSHALKILPKKSTLHIYNVTGCLGAVSSGDAVSISASYKITPAQTITSS